MARCNGSKRRQLVALARLPLWLALSVLAITPPMLLAQQLPEPAAAAPATAPPPPSPPPGVPPAKHPALLAAPKSDAVPVSGVGAGNLLMGLLFMSLLVGGAWWLVRRMGGLQAQGGARGGMQLLASLPVGPRERVVLVAVGGEQLLLGVAPGRVALLKRLDEPLALDRQGEDFAQKMRQLLQQGLGR